MSQDMMPFQLPVPRTGPEMSIVNQGPTVPCSNTFKYLSLKYSRERELSSGNGLGMECTMPFAELSTLNTISTSHCEKSLPRLHRVDEGI